MTDDADPSPARGPVLIEIGEAPAPVAPHLAPPVEDEPLPPPPAMERAMRLAARLQVLLSRPLAVGSQALYIDVSIGIALHSPQAPDAQALMRAANVAMHEAKRTPGTSIQFTDERFER